MLPSNPKFEKLFGIITNKFSRSRVIPMEMETHACPFTKVWKPMLSLGKLLGLIHVDGLVKKGGNPETWRPSRWTNVWGTSLAVCAITSQVALIIERCLALCFKGNCGNKAMFTWKIQQCAYITRNAYIIAIYLFLSWIKRGEAVKLLREFHLLICHSKSVCRTTTVLVAFIWIFAIVETVLYDVSVIQGSEGKYSMLQFLLARYAGEVPGANGYHPIYAFFRFVTGKLAICAWSYVDIIIILMSRGLASQYHILGSKVLQHIRPTSVNDKVGSLAEPRETLKDLFGKLLKINEFTKSFSRFFSPILLTLYFGNLLLISGRINRAILGADFDNGWTTAYVIVSLVQYLARLFLVTVSCAEVHHQGVKLEETLNAVGTWDMDMEIVSRMKKILRGSTPVGVDVYGMFVIKRSTILSVINILFSFQIILLQTAPLMDYKFH